MAVSGNVNSKHSGEDYENLTQTVWHLGNLRCSFAHELAQSVGASCQALNSIVCHEMAPWYAQNFQMWATNATHRRHAAHNLHMEQ